MPAAFLCGNSLSAKTPSKTAAPIVARAGSPITNQNKILPESHHERNHTHRRSNAARFFRRGLARPGAARIIGKYFRNASRRPAASECAQYWGDRFAHFSRLFHRIIGMPYHEYVTGIRIEKAKKLLEEMPYHSITQIGYEIGFGGLRNFESRFKKLTGQSPYQYRTRFNKRKAILFAKSAS
jgi:AraC-like DNA-binding protein